MGKSFQRLYKLIFFVLSIECRINFQLQNQMDPQQIPRGKRMPTQYLFLINGIASLLGYNALLTSLDYFNFVYKGYDVYSLFLPPVFLGYVVIVLSYRWISYKYSYKALVSFGIVLCNIALLILLILSLTCQNSPGFGFGLSLFCCFLLGAGSNCYQLTFFAQVNYLSEAVVSKFTIGTALGGLGITCIRMIIVAIAGTSQTLKFPIILYFIIAILFNFLTLVSNLSFFNSREFKVKIVPYLHHYKQDLRQKLEISSEQKKQQLGFKTTDGEKTQNQNEQDMSYFKILYLTGKSIFPYPILIFANYIMTFLVFPNLTVNKKFDSIQMVWSSLIFFFMYNLGDTIGKFICDYRWTFNALSTIYMFSTRAYFIIAIPLLATTVFDDDSLINNYFYPYLVQFLFALTNGIVTNASFIQSFEVCPVKYKKYAGVLGGITLQIGILVGTNLAIPFTKLFVSGDDT